MAFVLKLQKICFFVIFLFSNVRILLAMWGVFLRKL